MKHLIGHLLLVQTALWHVAFAACYLCLKTMTDTGCPSMFYVYVLQPQSSVRMISLQQRLKRRSKQRALKHLLWFLKFTLVPLLLTSVAPFILTTTSLKLVHGGHSKHKHNHVVGFGQSCTPIWSGLQI